MNDSILIKLYIYKTIWKTKFLLVSFSALTNAFEFLLKNHVVIRSIKWSKLSAIWPKITCSERRFTSPYMFSRRICCMSWNWILRWSKIVCVFGWIFFWYRIFSLRIFCVHPNEFSSTLLKTSSQNIINVV